MEEIPPKVICDCLAGDREAMGELVRHYQGRVFDILGRMTADRALAEDLAQEAFLRAIARLRLYRPERGPFSSWLFAIVRNLLRDHLARETVRRRGLRLLGSGGDGRSGEPAPERRVQTREIRGLVETEVERLPEEQRLALVLRVHQRLSYEEIARVTGVRIGTAKSRVARARSALRAALAPRLRPEAREPEVEKAEVRKP